LYLVKFLDTSAKSFFNCIVQNLGQSHLEKHSRLYHVIRGTAINNSRNAVFQSSPAGRHASHEPERNVNETHTEYDEHSRSDDKAAVLLVGYVAPLPPPVIRKDVRFSFCLMTRTKKGCAIVTLSVLARAECLGPLQSAPRAHYARFCGCTHSRCVLSLPPSLSLSLSLSFFLCTRAFRRGIITRGGLLLVLLPASPLPPPLPPFSHPLRPQPPSSTVIGARRSIYIATALQAVETWKEAGNRLAKET